MTGQPEEEKSKDETLEKVLSFLAKSIGTILSYCGIPGLVIILLFYFIEKHASSSQKELLIDSFFLMKNKDTYFLVFFILVVITISVLLIQNFYWKAKDKLHRKRIDELEKMNNKLQEKLMKLKEKK